MEPGIYKNISHEDYHNKIDAVSNSYLGRLDRVPAAAKIPQEETDTFAFGRAFHVYLLEGDQEFYKGFSVCETIPTKPNKRSTDKTIGTYQAWLESLNGKTPVSIDDYNELVKMRTSAFNHPFASKLLSEGVPETTLIWQDEETGLMCKARPDHTPDGNKGVLLDLKSTKNASEYAFRSDCVKYGYAREAGIYTEGFARLTAANYKDLIFAFIAVEKDPPYRVEVYTLDVDFLDYGVMEFRRLLNIEKKCRDNNFWPNYKNAGAQELQKPSYLKSWEWGE